MVETGKLRRETMAMASPADDYDDRYLGGIVAFNRGDYLEAHEVWEALWLDCPAADRRFYQSLIQAAVALYHWGNGNRAGAERLFAFLPSLLRGGAGGGVFFSHHRSRPAAGPLTPASMRFIRY